MSVFLGGRDASCSLHSVNIFLMVSHDDFSPVRAKLTSCILGDSFVWMEPISREGFMRSPVAKALFRKLTTLSESER